MIAPTTTLPATTEPPDTEPLDSIELRQETDDLCLLGSPIDEYGDPCEANA